MSLERRVTTLLLANFCSFDRYYRETIERWCGKSKDSRKGLGISMNREVLINIWCNTVTKRTLKKKPTIHWVYTKRPDAVCLRCNKTFFILHIPTLAQTLRRPQTAWSTPSSEEHWDTGSLPEKSHRVELQAAKGWAMPGGSRAHSTE